MIGYDEWKTGGNATTQMVSVSCENEECELFDITEEERVLVEYGRIASDLECPECLHDLRVS